MAFHGFSQHNFPSRILETTSLTSKVQGSRMVRTISSVCSSMGITCNQYAAVQLGVMGPGPIGNLRPPKKNIQNSDCIKINNKYSVNRGHPVCLHSSLKKMPNPARPNQELSAPPFQGQEEASEQ